MITLRRGKGGPIQSVTSSGVMRFAMNLQDLGIKEGLSIRRTAQGARILELAKGLNRMFVSMARVVQPTKLASLRVSRLDDSVTKEMVADRVVKASECDAGAVRIGEIMAGLGTYPIPELLDQRPLRCNKCMGIGHTRPTCPFAVDRSSLCYRCGKEGHIARNCTEAPCCAMCTSAGK